MRRSHLISWCVSQILVGIVAFFAFLNFAPWLATRSISEATAEALAVLPKDCPAYSVNHGNYICEWHDTIEKNPVGFWVNTGILAACLGFLYFTGFTGRGFKFPRPQSRLTSDDSDQMIKVSKQKLLNQNRKQNKK